MNFKLITKTFETPVHVWGACAFKHAVDGTIRIHFIPIRKLHEMKDLASELQIVAQALRKPSLVYIEWFKTIDLFPPDELK